MRESVDRSIDSSLNRSFKVTVFLNLKSWNITNNILLHINNELRNRKGESEVHVKIRLEIGATKFIKKKSARLL